MTLALFIAAALTQTIVPAPLATSSELDSTIVNPAQRRRELCEGKRRLDADECYWAIAELISDQPTGVTGARTEALQRVLLAEAERGFALQNRKDRGSWEDWKGRVLRARSEIAMNFHRQARFVEAEAIMREVSAEAVRDFTLLGAATSFLIDYAICLEAVGKPEEAEPFFRRAASEREQVFGVKSSDYIGALAFLGLNLTAQRRYDEANVVLVRAFTLSWVKGDDTLIADTAHHLAVLRIHTRDYRSAVDLLRKALVIREKGYFPDDPTLNIVRGNLGIALIGTSNFDEATPLLERAVSYVAARYAPDHRDRLRTEAHLAWLHVREGRNVGQARRTLSTASTVMRRRLGNYREFNAAAQTELRTLGIVSRGQIAAASALGGGAGSSGGAKAP